MAFLDADRQLASAIFFGRLVRSAYALAEATAAWAETRRTRKILASLSDHQLDDLGLCRGDIDAVARNGRRI